MLVIEINIKLNAKTYHNDSGERMRALQLYGKMNDELQFIESQLEQCMYSENVDLNESSNHLLRAGGKRLRPVFVLISGQFGKYDIERLSQIAVPLELIHMATLVHDDVIDNARTRRGQLTVKAKWDERIAMYTGDFIFGKALTIASKLEHSEIHKILSKSVVQMVIGEIEQLRLLNNLDQSIREYLLRIRRKTALLIAISCQLGALASGAPEKIAQLLYSYGYNVGMAFQIRDDILDMNGTEKQLGKPPGSDLKQGNITLPILYAIRDQQTREIVKKALSKTDKEYEENLRKAILSIRASSGIQQATVLSQRYIHKAISVLEKLPEIQAKKDLKLIANFIVDRAY